MDDGHLSSIGVIENALTPSPFRLPLACRRKIIAVNHGSELASE